MSYKSDVKPVYIAAANAVAFAGRTRLRGYVVQSTGSSGTLIIIGTVTHLVERYLQLYM